MKMLLVFGMELYTLDYPNQIELYKNLHSDRTIAFIMGHELDVVNFPIFLHF